MITKEALIQGIIDAHSEGIDMIGSKVEETKYRFTMRYCKRFYKSWDDALQNVLGITVADIKKAKLEQPKKDFLASLKKAHELGVDLSATAQHKVGRGECYYWKAQRFFKGTLFWEEALEAAGLPVQDIIRQNCYTKEKVKKILLDRLSKNESLESARLRESKSGLWKGILSNFTSYTEALNYSGIKTKGIIKKTNSWTPDNIILAIINLHLKGYNLNESYILNNYSKKIKRVVWSCRRHFDNGWEEAVNTAGIDYGLYRLRVGSWTREMVISAIIKTHEAGEPLNSSSISSDLYHAATRYVGGWQNAIEAAGLNYKDVAKAQKAPSKTEIIKMIKNLREEGCDVHCQAILKSTNPDIAKLYSQVARIFDGGWDEALADAGLKPSEIRQKTKKYTKEELSVIVKKWHGLGIDLSPSNITKNKQYSKYYRAAVRRFNSWDGFLKYCGIDPKPFMQHRDWKNGEEVLLYLKEQFPEGIVTGASQDGGFAAAAQKYFGSIEVAVNKAGLIYCFSGKMTKEILKNSRTIGILYKHNISFLEKIADKVFYSAYKNRTYERSDLINEGFMAMLKVLSDKPPKKGLREYCYWPIRKALLAYNKTFHNEVLWGEEVYFDLFGQNTKDTEDEDDLDNEFDDEFSQEDDEDL